MTVAVGVVLVLLVARLAWRREGTEAQKHRRAKRREAKTWVPLTLEQQKLDAASVEVQTRLALAENERMAARLTYTRSWPDWVPHRVAAFARRAVGGTER